MIPEETWQFVTKQLEGIRNRADEIGRVIELTGIPISSAIFGPFVEAEISLIKTLAFLTNDAYNIISRYVFEENFGKSYKDLKEAIENSYNKGDTK